ncbi:MAG: AMP-binding protein [Bacteroidetes bacterium]|nr:AMP-binding protein [Bacteroidota bacterium]
MRESFEIFLWGKVSQGLDGLILPTDQMKSFLFTKFPHAVDIPNIVFPIGLCDEYYCKNRLTLLSNKDNEHHIVFAGQFHPSYSINSVISQLEGIATHGIHVYFANYHKIKHSSVCIHTFEPYNANGLLKGDLSTHMSQFDACLVLYNIQYKSSRFQHSIPNRFFIALAAGIPIILKSGQLDACEKIVKEYEIGIIFSNPEDIAEIVYTSGTTGDQKGVVLTHNNITINIKLPTKMTFKVIEADPAIKGDTANNPLKTVKIETGLEVKTPMFISTNDSIVVDTRDGSYIERGK